MKHKLICFDLDGTLIDNIEYSWKLIHEHLETDENKRKKATKAYFDEKISYEEWALHDFEMWKETGATKKELIEAVKHVELMKGARETLKALKEKGYKLAVISGSINFILELVLPEYEEIFDDVFMNRIYFDDYGNIVKIVPTKYDFKHKATALREICKKEGIDIKETVFIGDHVNDVEIAKTAGLSIAFNSKSEKLNNVCNVVVEEKDLKEILKVIK